MHLKWFEKCLQNDENSSILESTCPPIQEQQSETVIHLELQQVLGTPLAANQQLAISTERNATSLHQWKIHRSWHICCFDVVQPIAGPLFWAQGLPLNSARVIHPEYQICSSVFETASTMSAAMDSEKHLTCRCYQRKTQTNEDNVGSTTTTPTPPTVQLVILVKIEDLKRRVAWTAQCGAHQKFTRSPTTLGHCHCCLKEKLLGCILRFES